MQEAHAPATAGRSVVILARPGLALEAPGHDRGLVVEGPQTLVLKRLEGGDDLILQIFEPGPRLRLARFHRRLIHALHGPFLN